MCRELLVSSRLKGSHWPLDGIEQRGLQVTYVLKGSPRPPTWEPTTAIPVRVRGAGRPDQDGSGGAGERRSGSRHSSKVELTGLTQLECGEGCDRHQGRQGISRRMSCESLNFRCSGPGCSLRVLPLLLACRLSFQACPLQPSHTVPLSRD